MTKSDLTERILNSIHTDTIFKNPRKGTSSISNISSSKISYKRGKSTISIQIQAFFDTYHKFKGEIISTRELKEFLPNVFDSSASPSGHSCNCTFFFLVLQKLELAGQIKGKGVRGNPFSIEIYN